MSPTPTRSAPRRATAWAVILSLLLPTIVACTTAPATPTAPGAPLPRAAADVARLDGIVVDGSRLAQGREPGLVWLVRDGYRQDAAPGMELRRGDRIETGPRAHAVIRYPSGTEVLMRPDSGGRIGSLTEFFGEVFVKVRGIFSVDTQFVTAGARGTAYLVRTYAGGTTGVTVVEGVVEVGSTTGAWPSVPIRAGATTLAHPRAPQPMPASLEELARTRDWVERVEQLATPPRGVSTGAIVGAVAIAAAIAAIAASGDRDRDRDHDRDRDRSGERDRGSDRDRGGERDRPRESTPTTPRAPDAPRALAPGAERAPGPTLDCRRGVMLRWAPVGAARDYLVALETESPRRGWAAARVAPTNRAEASVPASALGAANRWAVRARGAGESPASQTLYFACDFSGVR